MCLCRPAERCRSRFDEPERYSRLACLQRQGRSVKVEQVIDDFSLDYEYSVVKRYNRQRYMMMQCEPKRGANTMAAFSHLWKEVQEKIQVPEGYKMTYFGEQSEQDKGNKRSPLISR